MTMEGQYFDTAGAIVVITPLEEQWFQPLYPFGYFGLWLKYRHSLLLVVYLESPNYSPRASGLAVF
jgi:hypothetical protein